MKFLINGGNKLSGEIKVNGAKNAAIKIIAACILIKGKVTLSNVPDILDIQKIIEILKRMGAQIYRNNHSLEIDTSNLIYTDPDPELVQSIRASIILVGPLLARFGQVKIPHPGGDKIGTRPINLHIQAFQELGVEIIESDSNYSFSSKSFNDGEITFSKITVTGTENIILFAASKKIKVKIVNAAIEPEILNLIDFLNSAGSNISVDGRTIIVSGGELKPIDIEIIPDRIEAGTFACLAAATNSELRITDCNPKNLNYFLDILKNIGVIFDVGDNFLYIKHSEKLNSANIDTGVFPLLSTDLHPPIGVLMTQCEGKSKIVENIFENRLGYLEELKHMGADINIISNHEAEISGPTTLHGAEIKSLDIRAGATLVIAGLLARGKTIIDHAEIIDRGYEKIEERLSKLGADIKRVD